MTMSELYQTLLRIADAGCQIRVNVSDQSMTLVREHMRKGVEVAPLIAAAKAAKPLLLDLLRSGQWKPGDQVLFWFDDVFENYQRDLAAIGLAGLAPPGSEAILARYQPHNVVQWAA